MPATISATPRAEPSTPKTIRRRPLDGRVASVRNAVIGETRAARRAGPIAEMSVIAVPTSTDTMIVRLATIRFPDGSSNPMARMRPSSPIATAIPSASPSTDEISPTTNASRATEPMT